MPALTVIVPALNEEAELGRCLSALRSQDCPVAFEIVVVDNGSTDRTVEIAQAHGARVVAEPERGVCHARQRGLISARGAIVISTDADTVPGPGWLEAILERFADPAVVAVAGPCRYVDGPRWAGPWSRVLFGVVGFVARRFHHVGYVTATNLAFRVASLPDGYNVSLTQGGDELDVLRRLRSRGRVDYLADNPTFTSARRLRAGLAYSLVVSLGFHYLLGYLVNRIARRPVIHNAPAYRTPIALPRRAR